MLLTEALKVLIEEFQIPSKQLWLNEKKERLETSASVARKLAKPLKIRGFQVGIAEEYPIDSRFQVAYTPL